MKGTNSRATLLYVLSLIIFGSNGIVASYIHLPSYQIVFFRMLLATIFLLLLFLIQKRTITFYKFPQDTVALFGSGVSLGLQWIFLFEAYRLVGVGTATLEYYTGPIIVMALTPFIFGEKLSAKKILGFIVVVAGATLIVSNGVEQNLSLVGLSMGALAAILYAVMIVCNRHITQISGLENTIIQLGTGCIVVAITTLIFHGIEIPADPSSVHWIAVLIIGLFNTGVGSLLYFPQLTQMPVHRVAIFGYLEPLSAVIFSALILGEPFDSLKIIGTTCILGGAIFAEIPKPNKRLAENSLISK